MGGRDAAHGAAAERRASRRVAPRGGRISGNQERSRSPALEPACLESYVGGWSLEIHCSSLGPFLAAHRQRQAPEVDEPLGGHGVRGGRPIGAPKSKADMQPALVREADVVEVHAWLAVSQRWQRVGAFELPSTQFAWERRQVHGGAYELYLEVGAHDGDDRAAGDNTRFLRRCRADALPMRSKAEGGGGAVSRRRASTAVR